MKKILSLIAVTMLAMVEASAIQSGSSTQGSEFYFSFIKSQKMNKGSEDKIEKKTILYISAEKAGKITITDGSGTSVTRDFPAGSSSIALASISKEGVRSGDFQHCYADKNNSKQNEGVIVNVYEADGVTPQKVSLYAALIGDGTGDAANLYPIDALGNEYYVLSRGNSTSGKYGYSEALVVATEDNTEIEIYPTCLLDGQTTTAEVLPVNITLSKGQTYQIRALEAEGDLTGTIIRTKENTESMCKKIAVFSGTSHAQPGDYEYEQLLPKHLWGTEYLTVPLADNSVPVVRIVASEPCTEVRINGTLVATLNATQYYEYVDDSKSGAYIVTSKPVEVGQFTYRRSGSETNDASLVVLAPVKQMLNDVVFTPSENSYDGLNHRVTIVAPTANTADVTLQQVNGSDVVLTWNALSVNDTYSIATATIGNNAYQIKATKGGFNAIVYGYKSNKSEYSYSAGSSAIVSSTSFDLNGIDAGEISLAMCIDANTKFTPTLPSNITVSQVRWTIDEATPIKDASGNYTFVIGNNVYDETLTTEPFSYTANLTPRFYHAKMTASKTATTGYQSCFEQSTGNTDEVEVYFFVKDNKGGLDSVLTVCKGSEIALPSHSSGFGFPDGDDAASLNHYVWLASHDGGSTFMDTLSTATRPLPLATESFRYGVQDSVFIMASYNDENHCVVYQDTVRISVPSHLEPFMKITGGHGDVNADSTEIRFCNDGGKRVETTARYTLAPNVKVDRSSITEKLTNSGSDVTSELSSGIYSYSPVKTDDIEYTVAVSDMTGKECQRETNKVRVLAVPPFTASVTGYDRVKGISGNPLTLRMTGGNVDLTASTSPDSDTEYLYRWYRKDSRLSSDSADISDGVYTDQTKSLGVVEDKGVYTVTVTDIDSLCFSESSIEIMMDELRLPTMVIPGETGESFGDRTLPEPGMPSGDAASVQSILGDYTLYIFDRYGRKMAEEDNRGWQSDDMRKADAGVYFYVIESKKADGGKERIRGTVEVVKR